MVDIGLNEFKTLSIKEQNAVLFENIKSVKDMVGDFREKFDKHEKKDFAFYIATASAISILSLMLGVKLDIFNIPWL